MRANARARQHAKNDDNNELDIYIYIQKYQLSNYHLQLTLHTTFFLHPILVIVIQSISKTNQAATSPKTKSQATARPTKTWNKATVNHVPPTLFSSRQEQQKEQRAPNYYFNSSIWS
jgi:hypothetical protein